MAIDFLTEGGTFCESMGEENGNSGEGLGSNEDLVAEKAFGNEDAEAIEGEEDTAEEVVADRFWKRSGNASNFEDFVTCLVEKFAETMESEESGVSAIKDAFSTVVKASEEEH